MYKTKNGALCWRLTDFKIVEHASGAKVSYIRVQMAPSAPQRFEWVREDRLEKV